MAAADRAAGGDRPARSRRTASTAQGFASGDRHGWLDELCGHLQAAIWAAAAADLLADRSGWPARGAVLTLPCWRWAVPAADVGRKARAADGGTLLLPVRVDWEPGAVALVPQGRPVPGVLARRRVSAWTNGATRCWPAPRTRAARPDPGTGLPDRVTARRRVPRRRWRTSSPGSRPPAGPPGGTCCSCWSRTCGPR